MRIVVFLEGGLVQGVVDLDAKKPSDGVEYEVLDYDVLEYNSGEVKEYFERRSKELREYMRKYLPNEFAQFQKYINTCDLSNPEAFIASIARMKTTEEFFGNEPAPSQTSGDAMATLDELIISARKVKV